MSRLGQNLGRGRPGLLVPDLLSREHGVDDGADVSSG